VIARLIDWCARNRFLVFTAVFLLVLAGIWSMKNISLDALPDISDVQVIIHTRWAGEPPDLIEDQVTYPIVTTLLAAPRVTARTSTGRAPAFWNICSRSRASCRRACIRC
jgi:Cu(I)/Ag(I) efflux system membrane protein CusA/SilA